MTPDQLSDMMFAIIAIVCILAYFIRSTILTILNELLEQRRRETKTGEFEEIERDDAE